jgi:hypothetical protein
LKAASAAPRLSDEQWWEKEEVMEREREGRGRERERKRQEVVMVAVVGGSGDTSVVVFLWYVLH